MHSCARGAAFQNPRAHDYAPCRLTRATDPYTTQTFSYDANGNRLRDQSGSIVTQYAYVPGSQRLGSRSGSVNETRGYDAAGNPTNVRGFSTTYNVSGRLAQAGSAEYRYDGFGQRVAKTVNGVLTRYVYDAAGHLLAEADASGRTMREYVWLDEQPIAVLTPSTPGAATVRIDYIVPDHLGTPRLIIDSAGAVLWRWDSDPFGNSAPNEDPAGTGTRYVFNLRFPGQYFDAETGLSYNYMRMYEPGTGRYLESDPVGLAGGINTYLYANANPLTFTDPLGLNPAVGCVAGAWAGPLGCGVGAGIGTAIMGGMALAAILSTPGDTTKPEQCTDKPCPPCKTVSGKIVPVGTIGYRPMDTPSRPQHGITGSHFNIYKANQNPNNCQCFWQSVGAVPPSGLPAGAIPIEPFAN